MSKFRIAVFMTIFYIFSFMPYAFAQLSDEELSKKKTYTVWLQALANRKNVYKLDVSGGAIKTVPPEIKKLKNLHKLYIEECDLTFLPEEICELKYLQVLHIQRNKITKLPENIGKLKNLKELNLGSNPIPESEVQRVQKLLPNCKILFVD
jgi:Leucine-rich repeat (LRR) protein